MSNNILTKKGNLSSVSEMRSVIDSIPQNGYCYLITQTFIYNYPAIQVTYTKGELVYWDEGLSLFKQFTLPVSDLFTKDEAQEFNKNFQSWALHWFTNLVNTEYIKLPIIRDGTWWLYDYESEDYVDSNQYVRGPKGDTGPIGPQGPQGPSGSAASIIESLNSHTIFNQLANQDITNKELEFEKISGDIRLNGSEIHLESKMQIAQFTTSINFENNLSNSKYQDIKFEVKDVIRDSVIYAYENHLDSTLPRHTLSFTVINTSPAILKVIMNSTSKLAGITNFNVELKILGYNI